MTSLTSNGIHEVWIVSLMPHVVCGECVVVWMWFRSVRIEYHFDNSHAVVDVVDAFLSLPDELLHELITVAAIGYYHRNLCLVN